MNTFFADSLVIARRNVIKILRVPEILVFVLLSPIMFILLFVYVFGGAINVPNYEQFLVPGIFVQTVVFGATFTGVGIAEDMQKGIINRFRSLPMAPGAVLAGRTASDVVYNSLTLIIMALTGLLVGWRINDGAFNAIIGFALLLAFSYAMSWIMAFVALNVPSVDVINNASFMVIFPMTFIADTFVPTETLPPVLKAIAQWNPVSSLAVAARQRFGNVDPAAVEASAWSLQHPTFYTLIWIVILVAIFAPLSIAKYQKAVKK